MGGSYVDQERRSRGLDRGTQAVPLTEIQGAILGLIASSGTTDRYLAGGTALHFSPTSSRYSHDLDIFHDSEQRVAEAFAADREVLQAEGFEVDLVLSQPGFIRALVSRSGGATQIDWAHDSSWRFMPLVGDPVGGYLLHPVDLATNKVLALAGRDEPRDFVDIMYAIDMIMPLGAMVWGAVAKDPGYNGSSNPHPL